MKTRETMKAEALQFMGAMKLSTQCINAFKNHNKIWTSENGGMLYEDEQFDKLAKEVEKEYGGLVYHIEHSIFEFGECLSMFYVSNYEEDNDFDETLQDIQDGYAFCYVKNLDDDFCSEFGTIAFRPMFGGVKRLDY